MPAVKCSIGDRGITQIDDVESWMLKAMVAERVQNARNEPEVEHVEHGDECRLRPECKQDNLHEVCIERACEDERQFECSKLLQKNTRANGFWSCEMM